MAHLAHYKQAHPLPMKVTHWVNLVCMALLIFTGFLIHFPFWAGLTGVARGVHVFCGMLLVLNCILRIIFAFMFHSAPTGGTRNMVRDYKTYLPQADNRHQLGAWIKYYLFIKKDHPLSAKLGVPQKLSYLAVCVLILVMGYTGFCLWIPTASWSFSRCRHGSSGWHDVNAHHPLLHDVRLHLLLDDPHLPGLHRRHGEREEHAGG